MTKFLATIMVWFSLSTAALANTYSFDIAPSTEGTEYAFDAAVGLGSFTDTWTLNVLADSTLDGVISATDSTRVVNTILRSTGATLTKLSVFDQFDNEVFSEVPVTDTLTSSSFISKTYSFGFDNLPLSAMSYKFVVEGFGHSTNAKYDGFVVATTADNSNIDNPLTPVPEPEQSVMMLLGLSLISFKLRSKMA